MLQLESANRSQQYLWFQKQLIVEIYLLISEYLSTLLASKLF